MCAIIYLKKGQMIPKGMLWNAVYNNWHSYGLVTKVDNKLDIKKKVPENGEVNPQEVYDLLQMDIDYERFLHLRHNTAGATNLENTHPFDVYYDPKSGRQIVFMHNGTMYPYVSKMTVNGTTKDDPNGPSDTKNFVDQVLIPYISGCDFGNGKGDIHAPAFTSLIKKFWNGSNRGVLIANDQPALFIDDWKTVGPDDTRFLASNDTYFDRVQRGPENDRRLERQKAEEAKEKEEKQKNSQVPVVPLKNISHDKKHGFFQLSESPCNLLNDWDFYDRESCVSVGYMSRDEIDELFSDIGSAKIIIDWVFTDYAQLYEEFNEIDSKHDRATKLIAEKVEEIKKLKSEIKELKSKKTAKAQKEAA